MNELQDFEYVKFHYEKENLHDVFGTVLDTFSHIKGATVTGQVYLWDVLQRIKYNLAYDIEPDTYLLNKYVAGKRSAAYDKRKEQLPAICYNARFNGYKDTNHIKTVTNLMFLDIDDFPTREIALEYKKSITKKYNWIIACNLSLSKLGLHIITLVDKIHGNKDFNVKYDFISETYFNGRLDKTSKSLTRYTVIPFDYDIYINESPTVLEIDQIINEQKKGIRSVYIQDEGFTNSAINEKGISSAYLTDCHLSLGNNEKSIRSVYNPPTEEKIIYTPYTFSSDSSLVGLIMNDAARKHNLRFRLDVDESLFTDPNVPIYIREGVDVIDVNLFPLRGRKIYEGNRNKFLGALTVKMIYLNADSPEKTIPDIRTDILKFILHINKTICEPPLTYDEVIKSYNSNWKRYKDGNIDFSKYFKKQKAFWSKQSTLSANEKRSVTCKIKNAPIVEDTKRRIWEAIETLNATGQKITQKKVAGISGLSLAVVKKYRNEFHEYKKMLIGEPDILEIEGDIIEISEKPDVDTSEENLVISNNTNLFLENDCFELLDIDITDFEEVSTPHSLSSEDTDSALDYTEDQLQLLYQRIFNSLQNQFDENDKARLFEQFLNCFHQLSDTDARLLITPVEDITDSDSFWKQSTLERKIWDTCVEKISINYQ